MVRAELQGEMMKGKAGMRAWGTKGNWKRGEEGVSKEVLGGDKREGEEWEVTGGMEIEKEGILCGKGMDSRGDRKNEGRGELRGRNW